MKFESKVVHAGDRKRSGCGPTPSTTPIQLGTTYLYDSAEKLDRVMGGEEEGFCYSRWGNPTNQALEDLVKELESGHGALATASGMAASQIAVQAALLDRSHSILASNALYGATIKMFDQVFGSFGVDVSYVDVCDLDAVRKAVEKNKPGVLFIESISNPLMRVAPIPGLAEIAKSAGAALIVDNTFATPMIVRPLEHGAAMVVHSATKYLAGHGDVLGGVVVCDEEHNEIVHSLSRTLGPVLSPFDSYLTMRGIKTLAIRFERQNQNARTIAEWLRNHARVERVNYCSDPQHPDADAIKQLFTPGLYSAILSFEIRGADKQRVMSFMNHLKLIVPGTSLGDVHSLLLHPAMASHRDISPKMRERMGIRENLVRLAAGIESLEDIKEDLDQALNALLDFASGDNLAPLDYAMFAHHQNRVRVLAATADALWTILSFEAAYHLRTQMALSHVFFLSLRVHVIMVLFCAGVWVAIASRQRLYDRLSESPQYVISRTLQQCLLGVTLLVILQYVMNIGQELSRSFLALFFCLNLLGMLILRRATPLVMGAYQRRFGEPYHVVLVGNADRVERLGDQLKEGTPFRIDISETVAPHEAVSVIPELLRKGVVDEVVFAVDSETLAGLETVFLNCDEEGVRTRVAVDFFPHVNSEITLQRVGALPLLTFSAAPLEQSSLLAKRTMDILVSAIALIVLLPFFALIALGIRITSPGPAIYRQVRAGLNGRLFTMYKFRSMVQDAEALKASLEHLNQRQIAFKLKDDPRITALGRFLRKFSLDEFPQFYNVLRGDMSLVGPRPPLPNEVAQYERWQKRRLRMRPGLTCLWALLGRDTLDFDSWMRADLSYIDNWSFSLDWVILLRSIPRVLGGKGAH